MTFFGCTGYAQKALLLEKEGTLKTKKFYIGEKLIYKLKHDTKHWLDEVIIELDLESGTIFFENRTVNIKEICAVQIRDGGNFMRKLSAVLTTFSYSVGFWSLVSLAFDDPVTSAWIGIGLGSYVTGQLLRITFFKTYKLSQRKRLRLIDLTFYQLAPNRS
jgi:hypothetical protein